GVAKLPEGTEMVMPGDNVQMEIELIQPIAMDAGLRFAIREGGRTVGSGVVTEVIEEDARFASRTYGGGPRTRARPQYVRRQRTTDPSKPMAALTQNKIRIRL